MYRAPRWSGFQMSVASYPLSLCRDESSFLPMMMRQWKYRKIATAIHNPLTMLHYCNKNLNSENLLSLNLLIVLEWHSHSLKDNYIYIYLKKRSRMFLMDFGFRSSSHVLGNYSCLVKSVNGRDLLKLTIFEIQLFKLS